MRWYSLSRQALSVAALSLLAFCSVGPAKSSDADVVEKVAIPNMAVVSQNFYRGSQPDYGALERLKQAGVKVDICLDDEQRYLSSESVAAQALGLKFVSIPLSALHRPTAQEISEFLDVLSHKDEAPVYVHCVHGRDRTGAMVGIYRVVHDGWTPDAAYGEMLSYGFRPLFKSLADTVYDIAAQLGREGHRPTLGFIAGHLTGFRPRVN